jgi:3',5'-cyclic-AMP phosphodiesterase
LRQAHAPLVNVAGNHDTVFLNRDDLSRFWGRTGPLYYSFDHGDWHFVVLHTLEKKDVDVRIPTPQLEWLRADLAATQRPHLALVHERRELRAVFEEARKVRAVFNGHVHRNHLDVINGIPYVTVQSLIENLEDDEPGRPSASHAVVTLSSARMVVRVRGNDPARYQCEF